MCEKVNAVLEEYVRPLLHAHDGDIEVLSVEDGVLRFKFRGKCAGCPTADLTAEEVVEAAFTEHLPEIKQVILVRETSPELLEQAYALLRHRHGE